MKILVCTDGSKHSQKALEKALMLAGGCTVEDVAIIHVYKPSADATFPYASESITAEHMKIFEKMIEEQKKDRRKILSKALKLFKEKNIKARTMLKEGHPPHVIVNIAQNEGFDIIIIGSEGLSGLKKFFIGSVSNAVIQEAKNCSVLLVK